MGNFNPIPIVSITCLTNMISFVTSDNAMYCIVRSKLLLASGIVFNNVIAGAIISASAATIGSIVAFSLAKINTPVRTKALQLLDDYPSLRGIDKVVAKDGLKAVITLRLAPILPIPIGLYNYIYDVSNVSVLSFAIGTF
jgi:uncharacterized membrane protein YdjX (TVP38/TMEM64 family)